MAIFESRSIGCGSRTVDAEPEGYYVRLYALLEDSV